MENCDLRADAGTVILARVSTHDAEPVTTLMHLSTVWFVLLFLSVCACIGSTLGAMIRGEWYTLVPMGLGWFLFLSIPFVLRLFYPTVRRPRDFASILRRLVERTRQGLCGKVAAGSGWIAWMTETGIYQTPNLKAAPSGSYDAWSKYDSFRVERPHPSKFRVMLYRARPAPSQIVLDSLIVLLLFGGSVAIEISGANSGMRLFGMRDDVLATFAAALSQSLFQIFPISFVIRQTMLRTRNIRPADATFVINGDAIAYDELVTFLKRFLREEPYAEGSNR